MSTLASRIHDYPLTSQGVRDLDQPRQSSRSDPMRVNVGERERAVSALAGGALLATGLSRRGWLGLLLAWTGVGLLLRGATGHCAVNEALGRNTA